MPKGAATCNALLALIFNGTAWADIAENDSSSPLTNLYMALHTASLNDSSTQSTSETAYTNYARQPVARTTLGWSAPSGKSTSNVAAIEFPQCGVTGATLTAASIGKLSSGAGDVLYYADLNASIAVADQIQPRFAAGAATVSEA